MSQNTFSLPGFDKMNLSPVVLNTLESVGYKIPTQIQAIAIPCLIDGRDMVGQARTGTGKTAAFALPLLSRIDIKKRKPQVLVLTPTRELAIQVADSFKTYGTGLKGLSVLSIYGGQSYGIQLNQLKKGVHVIVGTPGRLMDHMRRKTLFLSDLSCVILDEADEMLHMGFIDDVKWILDKTPEHSQTALFSATMPPPILKIAQKYLNTPKKIIVKSDRTELETIKQQYWLIKSVKKINALVRIMEATSFDGVIVFSKTRASTFDIAKALESKGFKAEALNGDLAQSAREKIISRLKNGYIDIVVATDIAARGLDVDRISHVINYDMPSKVEPYIHRIGRTGRAGRKGEAILFLNRNERWMLKVIEKATRQKIREYTLPSNKTINKKRITDFNKAISRTIESEDLNFFELLIETYSLDKNTPVTKIAAALAKLTHGKAPFLLPEQKADRDKLRCKKKVLPQKSNIVPLEKGMERYRIEVGLCHGVRPKNIVGAISNESGLESKYIGNIDINQNFSFVDLPYGMPKHIFKLLEKTRVSSQKMSISKYA